MSADGERKTNFTTPLEFPDMAPETADTDSGAVDELIALDAPLDHEPAGFDAASLNAPITPDFALPDFNALPVSPAATSPDDAPASPEIEASPELPANGHELSEAASPEPEYAELTKLSEPTQAKGTKTATIAPAPSLATEPSAFERLGPPLAPFTIRIEGRLEPHEQARLKEILLGANLDIQESDLDLQIEAGRVFIPQINETIAVLVAQKLRSTQASMRFLDAARANEAEATRSLPFAAPEDDGTLDAETPEAENLPITTDAILPELPDFKVIEPMSASLTLSAEQLAAKGGYDAALDALKLELRYRAHRRGAHALIRFFAEQQALSLGSGFRLTASAVAVRAPA